MNPVGICSPVGIWDLSCLTMNQRLTRAHQDPPGCIPSRYPTRAVIRAPRDCFARALFDLQRRLHGQRWRCSHPPGTVRRRYLLWGPLLLALLIRSRACRPIQSSGGSLALCSCYDPGAQHGWMARENWSC